MIKKGVVYVCVTFLLTFFLVQGVMAQDEYVLEHTVTSMTPVFMSGHEGDLMWIEGFNVTTDVFLDGSKVGTTSIQVTLLDPPMSLTDRYAYAIFKAVNSISGMGTYEVTAQAISLNSSTTPSAGDITLAWSGSISNGTDGLSNIYGLSTGAGIANTFTGQGNFKEIIRVRFGY